MGSVPQDTQKANIKAKIAELEAKAKLDPLKRHPEIHEEIERLKKALEEE